jgi:molybdopterin-guanine dinucleotide biosynthesis protein A
MNSIDGFILTGGQSSRMGTDKSRLLLHGKSFVTRIADQLNGVVGNVFTVGRDSVTEQLPFIGDLYQSWGALGGVHAALAGCSADWALIVACDFPFVTGEMFSRLAAFRENFEAVAPVQPDEIPQPLCALYRVNPCLGSAISLIESGERKPVALLQSVSTRWVTFNELSDLDGSPRFFENINTPEDYARIVEKGVKTEEVVG